MPLDNHFLLCEALVRKLSIGQSLDAKQREHLSKCDSCMREVVQRLDKAFVPEQDKNGTDIVPAHAGSSKTVPEEVRVAIEQGRRVLEREFGIQT